MDAVKIKGFVNNVKEIFTNYNIGVVCSQNEPFGRVTVEYMLSALPIIATNSGANPELIEDGQDGLLYPYGNSEILSKRIIEIISNPDLAKSISSSAYLKAKRKFTAEANADAIYSLLRKRTSIGEHNE